jgi:hypothetical protein
VSIWLGAALLAGVVPATAADAQGPDEDCRQEWSDLTSLHAENGNPEGPVPALNDRWEVYSDTAAQYAQTATAADCGAVIESFGVTWGDLESFQYDLYRFDPMGRLAIAEGDREHALSFGHTKHLSPRLEQAFRVARRQAPRAAADLAPALGPAAAVNVDDPAAVGGVVAALQRAARHSHHQQRLNQVLRVIGDAELSEE